MSFSVFFYASLAPKEDLYRYECLPLKVFFHEHHALLSCLNTTIFSSVEATTRF